MEQGHVSDIPGEDRDRLVRRTMLLLSVAQAALWGAIGSFAFLGPISAFELSGRESLSPVLLGVYFAGVAAGARTAGAAMDRWGHRWCLAAGYLLIAGGGAGSAAAVASGSVMGLLAAVAVLGAGVGPAQLARASVAAMFPSERRGRAVGTLIVTGTVGAVGGAPLAGALHALAENMGFGKPLALAWLLVPALGVLALMFVAALRPDPARLALGLTAGQRGRRPLEVFRIRAALTVLILMGVSQALMNTFMGVVPVVIHSHGSSAGTVSLVVGLHLSGMFAFSRFIGSALDRWGRRPGLLAGVIVLAAGILLSLVSGSTLIPALGMLLIGIGWSTAFIGSTAVVSDLTTPAERSGVIGFTDLVVFVFAAAGIFLGAFILEVAGFRFLVFSGLALLLLPVAMMVFLAEPHDPETSPGPD